MKNIAKNLRINEKITSREVRVIGLEGNQLGIFSAADALNMAREAGVDLVEVSANASPPVCRIMDYGKFKYQQSKKMHQAKKHSHSVAHIKEVKVRPRTEEHDLQVKIRNIKKFLTHGNKAKVTLMFRGREMAHPEFGKEVMDRISEEIQDVGVVENPPKLEGRNMIMLLAPKS